MNVEWLKQICGDPAERPLLSQPFSVERGGEIWSGATNGHVMALTRGDYGFAPSQMASIHGVVTIPAVPPVDFPLAELRALIPAPTKVEDLPPCDECESTGYVECEECDGLGTQECECFDCGHQHDADCDECKGEGKVPCDCGRVAARANHRIKEVVQIRDAYFNLETLAKVVPFIPDAPATWRQQHPERAAWIEAGDWQFLIMPLRLDMGWPVKHRIELPEPAAACVSRYRASSQGALHTPGPWKLLEVFGGTCLDNGSMPTHSIRADNKAAFAQFGLMGDYTGGEVAVVVCNPAVQALPEWRHIEANARLIAAAPALLAACKKAVNALEGCAAIIGPMDGLTQPMIDLVHAAIAKAEGR